MKTVHSALTTILFFTLTLLAAPPAGADIFNFGLDFFTDQNGDFAASETSFFDGDQTAYRLRGPERVSFVFNTSAISPVFIIDSAEIYVDARGIRNNRDPETGVLRVRNPGLRLGRLNRLNRNVEVPVETGGRMPNDGIIDPDDKDNSFFDIPPAYYTNILGGELRFRIRARDGDNFRVDGANLQAAAHAQQAQSQSVVPEPGTLSLMGLGLAGFALKRRQRRRASKRFPAS